MHDGNVGSIVCSGSEQPSRGTPRAVLEPSRLGCPPLVGRDYLHGFRAMLGDWELGSGNWQSGIGNHGRPGAADLLLAIVAPAAMLPVIFLKLVGQIPFYHPHPNTG